MRFLQGDQGKNAKTYFVKLICLLTAAMMLLTACGDKEETTSKKKKKKPAASSSQSQTVSDNSSEDNSSEDNFIDLSSEDTDSFDDFTDDNSSDDSSSEDEDEGEDLIKPVVDRSVNKSFCPEKYSKLAWSDEFDGNSLDMNKWTYDLTYENLRSSYFIYNMDETNHILGNGLLRMVNTHYFDPYDPLLQYVVANDLCTQETMNFRYGYLEMCAKVPYVKGCWPAFWLKSAVPNKCVGGSVGEEWNERPYGFMAEIDIFEIFNSLDTATPNIHKWYNSKAESNGAPEGRHTQYSLPKNSYTFDESDNLRNEYHVYGFEWTKDYIAMSVDGEEYMRFDINYNYDGFGDMKAFHDPYYIILGNGMYAPDGALGGNAASGEDLPVEFAVDWIRIYQDPNDSESRVWTK